MYKFTIHFPLKHYCGGSPAENLSGGSPLVALSEFLLGRSSGCRGARVGGGLICSETPGLRNDLISFLSLDIFVGEGVVAAVVEAVVVAEVEAVVAGLLQLQQVGAVVAGLLLRNGMGLNCDVFLLSIPEGVWIS